MTSGWATRSSCSELAIIDAFELLEGIIKGSISYAVVASLSSDWPMEKCRGTRTEKGRSTRGSALELKALQGNVVATQELDQAMEGRNGVAVVEGQVVAEGAEL